MLLETLELESAFPLTGGSQLLTHKAGGYAFGVSRPMLLFWTREKRILPSVWNHFGGNTDWSILGLVPTLNNYQGQDGELIISSAWIKWFFLVKTEWPGKRGRSSQSTEILSLELQASQGWPLGGSHGLWIPGDFSRSANPREQVFSRRKQLGLSEVCGRRSGERWRAMRRVEKGKHGWVLSQWNHGSLPSCPHRIFKSSWLKVGSHTDCRPSPGDVLKARAGHSFCRLLMRSAPRIFMWPGCWVFDWQATAVGWGGGEI